MPKTKSTGGKKPKPTVTKDSRTPVEDDLVQRHSPWAGGRRHPRRVAAATAA